MEHRGEALVGAGYACPGEHTYAARSSLRDHVSSLSQGLFSLVERENAAKARQPQDPRKRHSAVSKDC